MSRVTSRERSGASPPLQVIATSQGNGGVELTEELVVNPIPESADPNTHDVCSISGDLETDFIPGGEIGTFF